MNKKSMAAALVFSILAACTTLTKNSDSSLRQPSSAGPVQAADLQRVGVLGVLEELRSHCCGGVMIAKSDVSFWGEADIAQLTQYVNDTTPVSPVYRPSSGVSCNGPKYTSTLGHEARHLIEAIKRKTYPLSQCSTYDLHLE